MWRRRRLCGPSGLFLRGSLVWLSLRPAGRSPRRLNNVISGMAVGAGPRCRRRQQSRGPQPSGAARSPARCSHPAPSPTVRRACRGRSRFAGAPDPVKISFDLMSDAAVLSVAVDSFSEEGDPSSLDPGRRADARRAGHPSGNACRISPAGGLGPGCDAARGRPRASRSRRSCRRSRPGLSGPRRWSHASACRRAESGCAAPRRARACGRFRARWSRVCGSRARRRPRGGVRGRGR